jgi:mannose-6-phosphate isomerase-like protein (cupin superfamily)
MYLPTEIANPVTGERIRFDETASTDERLVWREERPANVEPPPVHYHPETEERFEVREGVLVVEVDGETHRIEAGEGIVIPPATPHVSYTEAESARFEREVTPPGRWREALTARFAAVHAVGDLSGVTGRLQTVLLARAYPAVVVPRRPPRAVQRVLFPVLAAVARLVGLQSHYRYPRTDASADDDPPAERPT